MPINSGLMLAPISLAMAEQKELLAAEQPELDFLREHLEAVRQECSISTCSTTIGRYERIFGLPAGGKTLEERRAALLFYLNARILITKSYLEGLLTGVLQCRCSIEEYAWEYRFTVNVEGENKSPNLAEAARYVRLLKPAHLEVTIRYRQREHGRIIAAMRTGIGLYIKILPYQPEDITETGTINTSMFVKGAQRLQIYAKEN